MASGVVLGRFLGSGLAPLSHPGDQLARIDGQLGELLAELVARRQGQQEWGAASVLSSWTLAMKLDARLEVQTKKEETFGG